MTDHTDELAFLELSRYMLSTVHPSTITSKSLREKFNLHHVQFNSRTVQRLLSLYLHVYEVDCPLPVLRIFFNFTDDILRSNSIYDHLIPTFEEIGCTICEQDFIDSELLYTREFIPTWTRRSTHE